MLSVVHEIAPASAAYAAAANVAAVYLLTDADFDLTGVTRTEMSKLYELKFAAKGSAGRRIYDEIKLAPRFGRCPLCGHRDVSTLDHHLPRARYAALAVAALDLIPACGECNIRKGSFVPATAEQQTLNPYFDDVGNEVWLHATVAELDPVAFEFFAGRPANWSSVLCDRVSHHFRFFGLAELYSVQAAQEFANIRYDLTLILKAGATPEDMQAHLSRQATSRSQHHSNSWQSATYSAMASSVWFCSGGWLT
ncbi:hypothetical protein ACWF0M_08630 [Kribbella sp. NPDC055110]